MGASDIYLFLFSKLMLAWMGLDGGPTEIPAGFNCAVNVFESM